MLLKSLLGRRNLNKMTWYDNAEEGNQDKARDGKGRKTKRVL